jgi:hypothetical protein
MSKFEFWIDDGCIVERPTANDGGVLSDRALVQSGRYVKIETIDTGTTVKWCMFAPNWASLYFTESWLHSLPAPFTLRFFNAGWFSEKYDTAQEAADRISQVVAKADVRFSARAFSRQFIPTVSRLPDRLREAWEAGAAPPDATVVCSVDSLTGISQVESVGHASAIASIWGVSPVTFPCLTGHSYDRVVSGAYHEVLRTGRPNYSHVIAAMAQPDGETQWHGYQRVVFPGANRVNGNPTVNVVGYVSAVEIPLL